jgi:hypothetical protein
MCEPDVSGVLVEELDEGGLVLRRWRPRSPPAPPGQPIALAAEQAHLTPTVM